VQPACSRCSAPVVSIATEAGGGWSCPEHGPTHALWRPTSASYDALASHLGRTRGFPTYLPWPMSPGWSVSDLAAVTDGERVRGTLTCVTGTSELDGPVDVLVVSEEPGTGLGARVAGTPHDDPGLGHFEGQPLVRVRLDQKQVPLWSVSTSASSGEWDRSVVAGEAFGRWLWIVVRPASAVLLLRDDWILRDVAPVGPPLVELPFAGPAPPW
jgi:hypothetical protein